MYSIIKLKYWSNSTSYFELYQVDDNYKISFDIESAPKFYTIDSDLDYLNYFFITKFPFQNNDLISLNYNNNINNLLYTINIISGNDTHNIGVSSYNLLENIVDTSLLGENIINFSGFSIR